MTELDIGNHHFTGITKALLAEQLTSLCPDGLDYACFSTCEIVRFLIILL